MNEKMLQLSEDAIEFANTYSNLKSRIIKRLKDNFVDCETTTLDGFKCTIKEHGIEFNKNVKEYGLFNYEYLMYLFLNLID